MSPIKHRGKLDLASQGFILGLKAAGVRDKKVIEITGLGSATIWRVCRRAKDHGWTEDQLLYGHHLESSHCRGGISKKPTNGTPQKKGSELEVQDQPNGDDGEKKAPVKEKMNSGFEEAIVDMTEESIVKLESDDSGADSDSTVVVKPKGEFDLDMEIV